MYSALNNSGEKGGSDSFSTTMNSKQISMRGGPSKADLQNFPLQMQLEPLKEVKTKKGKKAKVSKKEKSLGKPVQLH